MWISEIMLQQTRVETVIPYYRRWMRRFPNIEALAAASQTDVLAAWEGLGYYARARNLRLAARRVLDQYGGRIPADLDALRGLPGVGQYTAGAVASIAFGIDVPALDGNIRRVLARLFNVGLPADSTAGRKRLWQLARINLPKGRAGDYNQALMDLGATLCLPKRPRCNVCPLRRRCLALRLGTIERRPVLRPRKAIPEYSVASAAVIERGRVLLSQRVSHGLLGGLWEFPNVRMNRASHSQVLRTARFSALLERDYGVRVLPNGSLGTLRHTYSHFRVQVDVHACKLLSGSPGDRLRWVRIGQLANYPMGKVDRQIASQLADRGVAA